MIRRAAHGSLVCNRKLSLWSDLANKLSGTKSFPEAFEAYSKSVSQRMQMAAEDGRKLVDECQQLTQKFTKSLGTDGRAQLRDKAG